MRKFLTVALSVGLFLGTLTVASPASAATAGKWRSADCRFGNLYGGPEFSKREVIKTIWCFENKMSVPGGVRKAKCFASHESGFYWGANNPRSTASGIYQIVSGTWQHMVTTYRVLDRRFGLSESVWNARANVARTIRTAHGGGWGPWEDFASYSCG